MLQQSLFLQPRTFLEKGTRSVEKKDNQNLSAIKNGIECPPLQTGGKGTEEKIYLTDTYARINASNLHENDFSTPIRNELGSEIS